MEYIHYNPVAAGLCTYPEDINIHQQNFMKPEWMSLAFLHIAWLNAVVGEARLKKPPHETVENEKTSLYIAEEGNITGI
jgi:hypothetical protein